jgi:hypothetical protein
MRRITVTTIIAGSLLFAGTARADQLVRKAGEWRTTVTGFGGAPQTMEMCLTEKTMEQAMASPRGKTCSKKDVKINGNQATIDLECGTMTMQGSAIIAGDTAYTADLTMHITTSHGPMVIHTTSDAKWIGDCKPGEKPIN